VIFFAIHTQNKGHEKKLTEEKMRKKTIFVTLVIMGMLFVSSLPTMLAYATPDIPTEDCWVVTDDVEDEQIDEHNFYDERDAPNWLESDHEQVWYKENGFFEPYPISNDDEWIDTTVRCGAVSSGDNVILYVSTYGYDPGEFTYATEYLSWTIINGGGSGNFSVKATWYKWTQLGPVYRTQTVLVSIDDLMYDIISLDYCQAVDLEFTYRDLSKSPGQKEYWIETDYDTYEGKDYIYVDLPGENDMGQQSISSNNHELTWWTDKDPYNCPLYETGPPAWHINTKALISVEVENENNLKVSIMVYGESNYHPETVNWTITGGNDVGAFFRVSIDTEDSDLLVDIDKDDEEYFQVLGVITDPMDLNITWYDRP